MSPSAAALAAAGKATADPSRVAQVAQAAQAYGQTRETTSDPRAQHADVFARAVRALRAARDGTATDGISRSKILLDNEKLWRHIAAENADPGSPLPAETRANLVSLADFVLRHSQKVRTEGAPLDPLIQVNHRMYAGLIGHTPDSRP